MLGPAHTGAETRRDLQGVVLREPRVLCQAEENGLGTVVSFPELILALCGIAHILILPRFIEMA